MIEKIILNDKVSAILITKNAIFREGAEFITSNNQEFQVGLMNRDKGYEIDPHFHKTVKRNIKNTSEALFVKSGKIKCTIFDSNNASIKKTFNIEDGDLLVIFNSAHKFTFLEKSEIIEIKQGPFIESKTKFSNDTS
jgi:hypothetical protein